MRSFLLAVMLLACGNDKGGSPSSPATTPISTPSRKVVDSSDPPAHFGKRGADEPTSPPPAAAPAPAGPGHDFTEEARALLVVGACGVGTPPATVPAKTLAHHCEVITKAQADYLEGWMKKASAFFDQKVPKGVPKKVVYPFAGGDLSTALTVYPDADEITTLSLEPAGDPRTLATLRGAELTAALAKVEYELKFLYRVNFSNTLNMIDAMRGGALPTQLIFGLSALKLHGYELVALHYFRLDDDGSIHYLNEDDIRRAPDPKKPGNTERRNFLFANAEVQFRRPGGRVQVWRHIRANLGNETSPGIGPGLKADPRVVRHLESKGQIAAMTKAASYLLSWDSFSIMRNYLLKHVQWMVSDATGVAPKWGKPAGFEYETYGDYIGPHIEAGTGIAKDWKTEFEAQGRRELAFRFGYYDKKFRNHLVIMKKKA